jgi:hypothetical protein
MKKVIMTMLVLLVMVFGLGNVSFASTGETTGVIGDVFYDEYTHSYRFETVPVNGESWTYDIVLANHEDKALTQALQRALVGKRVVIEYDTQGSDNSEDCVATGWRLE